VHGIKASQSGDCGDEREREIVDGSLLGRGKERERGVVVVVCVCVLVEYNIFKCKGRGQYNLELSC